MQTATFYTSTTQLASSPGGANLIKTAAVAANALPPPWGPILAQVLAIIGGTYQAVATYRLEAIAQGLVTLPKNFADSALSKLSNYGAGEFVEALQSFIVYRSIGDGAKESAFRALRAATGVDDKMRTRIAKEVRAAVLAAGAPSFMADHAAFLTAYVESRRDWTKAQSQQTVRGWRDAVLATYPAGTTEAAAYTDRLDRWQKGLPQAGSVTVGKDSGVPWLLIGGIAAVALAFRGRR